MALTLTEALIEVEGSARRVSQECAVIIAAGSPITYAAGVDFSNLLAGLYTHAAAMEVVPGIAAFASAQANKTITAQTFTDYKTALANTCNTIGGAITGVVAFSYNSGTRIIISASLTAGQMTSLKSLCTTLKAAADALIP